MRQGYYRLFILCLTVLSFLNSQPVPLQAAPVVVRELIVPTLAVREQQNGQQTGAVVLIRFSLVSGVRPGVYLYDPIGNLMEILMGGQLRLGRLQQIVGVLVGDVDLVVVGTIREIWASSVLLPREQFETSIVNAYNCARYYCPELKRYAIFIGVPQEVLLGGDSAGAPFAVGMYVLVKNLPTRPGIAMTGTISPSGDIGPVGGIREKITAAGYSGFKVVLLPAANLPDIAITTLSLPVTAIPVRHFKEAVFHFTGQVPEEGYKQLQRAVQRIQRILADPNGNLEVAAQVAEDWMDLMPEVAREEEVIKKALRLYKVQKSLSRCVVALQKGDWAELLANTVAVAQAAPDDPKVQNRLPDFLTALAKNLEAFGESCLTEDYQFNLLVAFGDLLAKAELPEKSDALRTALRIASRLFEACLQEEGAHQRFQRWMTFLTRWSSLEAFYREAISALKARWEKAVQGGDVASVQRLYRLAHLLPQPEALAKELQNIVLREWTSALGHNDAPASHRILTIADNLALSLVSPSQRRWLAELATRWDELNSPLTCLSLVERLLSEDEQTIAFVLPFLTTRVTSQGAPEVASAIDFVRRFFSPERSRCLGDFAQRWIDNLAGMKPANFRLFYEKAMAGIFVGTNAPAFWVALTGVFQPDAWTIKAYTDEALARKPVNEWAILLPFCIGAFAGGRLPPPQYSPSLPLVADVLAALTAQRGGSWDLAAERWKGLAKDVAGAKREVAVCYAVQGKWGAALFWLTQHLHDYPFDPIALSDLAWWLEALGAPEPAEKLLASLSKTHPLNPYVWAIVARCQKRGICQNWRLPAFLKRHPIIAATEADLVSWVKEVRPVVVAPLR